MLEQTETILFLIPLVISRLLQLAVAVVESIKQI